MMATLLFNYLMFTTLRNLDPNDEEKLPQKATSLDFKRKRCQNRTGKASEKKNTDSKKFINRRFNHSYKKSLQRAKHRGSRGRCSIEKVFLNVLQKSKERDLCWSKHLCRSLFLNECNFVKKEAPTQVFSCELCKNF